MQGNRRPNHIILVVASVAFFSLQNFQLAHAADSSTSKTDAEATKTNTAAKPSTKAKPASAKKQKATGKITEGAAVKLVMAMPEVKQFFKNVTSSKLAKPAIDMDRIEGDAYVVHVYEIVNDGPETSHTATKNWYYVNSKTGKITKEF